jgi:hypothetical protein
MFLVTFMSVEMSRKCVIWRELDDYADSGISISLNSETFMEALSLSSISLICTPMGFFKAYLQSLVYDISRPRRYPGRNGSNIF